jgi:S1-C subfamily serine protease
MTHPRQLLQLALLFALSGPVLPRLSRRPAPPTSKLQPLPDFRKLVKQNEAAVVNISSTQASSRTEP